jgi:hypothetical protein
VGSNEAGTLDADGKRILESRRYGRRPTNKLSKTTIHHSMTYETKMDDEIKGTRTWNLKWDSKE